MMLHTMCNVSIFIMCLKSFHSQQGVFKIFFGGSLGIDFVLVQVLVGISLLHLDPPTHKSRSCCYYCI